MEINLNDVALFVRVVQTGSFSAAARERGVPVSTASRGVARLESAVGMQLLERTTRALRLTEGGGVYFDHCVRAMDDLAQGSEALQQRQLEPRGRVRILAPTWLADTVASVIVPYLAKHAEVGIDLELDQRAVELSSERFDIAIVAGKPADTNDFVARAIWPPAPKLLVASPRYLEVRGRPRNVRDLARHDLIATRARDGFETWTLMRGRAKRRHTFAPRLLASEIAVARRAVLAGLGIMLMPDILCAEDFARHRLVHVLKGWEGERGGVHLLYRAHRSLTAAVRTCIDHLLTGLPDTDPTEALRRPGR